MQASKVSPMTIVFNGGEATTVPASWFKIIVEEIKRIASQMGKKVKFTLQTNASFWNKYLVKLCVQERFHISAHFDGLALDPDDRLQSKQRLENIQRYTEMGLSVSAIIVGTRPALKKIVETMELLMGIGVSRFRLNYIAPVGRGKNFSDMPSCTERAEAEINAIFYSSQEDFTIFDPVLLEKPIQYFRRILIGRPLSGRPQIMQCGAGEHMIHLTADGGIFPCSMFTDKTPLLAKAINLPEVSPQMERSIQMFKQESPWYIAHCPVCPAYAFCTFHCPLTPIEEQSYNSYFCGSQRELRKLFDANQQLIAIIAQRIEKKIRSNYLTGKGSC